MASLLSFFGDLGKKLHGVEAQINPWDNGATYNSVVNNAPRTPQPAPQQVTPPQLNFNTSSVSPQGAPNLPSLTTPKVPTVSLPPQMPTNRLTIGGFTYTKQGDGTYKNNLGQTRTQDQLNNLQQGQNQFDQAQQAIHNKPMDYVGDVVSAPFKVGKDIVTGTATGLINTVKLPTDAAMAGVGALTHNQPLQQGAQAELGSDFKSSLPGMIYHPLDVVATALGSSLAANSLHNQGMDDNIITNAVNDQTAHVGLNTNNSTLENDRKIGSAAAQIGLNLAMSGNPLSGSLVKEAGAQTGKVLTRDALKAAMAENAAKTGLTPLQQATRSALTNAGYGAAGGAVSTLEQDKIKPTDFITNAAIGGAGGLAFGMLPHVAATVADATPGVIQNARAMANDQSGALNIGKIAQDVGGAMRPTNSHPAIVELNNHLGLLRQADEQMAQQGLAPNYASRVNNHKAQQAVVEEIMATRKKIGQGGFIAGPLAGDFSNAKKTNQVFEGVDGKPRFEVSDQGAKINPGGMDNPYDMTLGGVLNHPELYKNYPNLAKIPVEFEPQAGYNGSFDGSTIRLNPDLSSNAQKSTLIHELQHAIQDKEGFAQGGPAGAKYQKLAGEAEARAVAARKDMPMSERYKDLQEFKLNTGSRKPYEIGQYSVIAENRKEAAVKGKKRADKFGINFEGIDPADPRATTLKRPTFYDSLDVPKDELIIKHGGGVAKSLRDNNKSAKPSTSSQGAGELNGSTPKIGRKVPSQEPAQVVSSKGSIPAPTLKTKILASKPADYFFGDMKPVQDAQAKVSSSAQRPSSRVSESNAPSEPGLPLRKEKYSSPQTQTGSSRAVSRASTPSTPELSLIGQEASRSGNAVSSQESRLARTPRQESTLPAKQTSKDLSKSEQSSYPQTTRKRGFSQSVKGSDEVSGSVRKRAGGTYETRNTQKMVDKAENFTNGSLSKATDSVMSALDRHKGTISDQEITNAITVAKRLDANGTHAQAGDIYSKLDEHLREHGRAVQAASVLSRRTPEGLHYGAIKELKKHGVNVTPELAKNISEKIKQIKGSEQGSLERNLHIKELQKMVADNVPSDRADKLTGIWKAGLLSGIRTQTGNALSNETFSILHNISNLAAVPLDKAASLITHSRTKTLTGRGLVKGTGEGYKQGYNYLKTGIDERAPLENKYLQGKQLNFKNKAINTYVNGIFRLMGAADRPHYYRQLRNSLYDLGKADGLNQGLKGKALRDHMEEFAKNPPEDKFQLATNEAEQAVLANDTLLSKAAGRIQKLTEEAKTPVGKFVAKVAVNGIAPFTKVPSAFISRVIDFTPAGALKEVVTQISRKHFDQRALVTAIAEAGTGYALMSVGSSLAQNGLISGNYPNDPKEQQRWKAQGIQPNSVKVGDNWYSLNYFGPVGMLFAAGSRINDAKQNGGGFVSQQAAAYGGMPKDLTEQSFLQGLNNSLEAINEPGRYLNNLVKSNVSSVVPTIVNDVATATDKLQRQSDNAVDAVKSRVPGLRETLKPAQDVYGNQLPRKTGTLGTLVNPLRPSKSITNSVKSEVERLHNADPTNSDLQVTPTPVGKTLTVEGNKIALTNQQRYDLQTTVGNTVQSEWGKLIKTPEYKALDDAGKAKALSNLRSDATSVATRQFATQNNLATYKKGLTAKQSALGNGSDVSSYATNANNTGSVTIAPNLDKQSSSVLTKYNAMSSTDRAKTFNTQPSAEYDYYRAKYNNDKANGALSDVQDIRARKSLAKDKVGSVYPKTVRDLYGLSKADISAYLSTSEKGVDKQKLAKQLIAYDQALHNAGLSSYLKFKTGIAPSKKRSGGSKKKASGIKPSASLESIIKAAAAIKAPTSPAASKPKATAYQKTALKGYTTKYPSQKGAPVTVRRGIV